MKRLLYITLSLLLIGAACQKKAPTSVSTNENATAATAPDIRGVSISPKSFSAGDLSAFFDLAEQAGDFLSWAGNWSDLTKANNAAALTMRQTAQRGMRPVLIVGMSREEIVSDATWALVQEAIVNFAKEYQPPYIGIGNEINKTFDQSTVTRLSQRFAAAQTAIKAVSPSTAVFPTWQLEWMKGNHGGLFGGKNSENNAQWDQLDLFPSRDLTVFTTYPCLTYKDPADIPAEYYGELLEKVSGPIAFSELGWFRSGPVGWDSTPEEQAEFIQTFRQRTASVLPIFTIWPFVFDPKTDPPFETIGFMATDASTSSGWEEWTSQQ